jgi:hypothetical protein
MCSTGRSRGERGLEQLCEGDGIHVQSVSRAINPFIAQCRSRCSDGDVTPAVLNQPKRIGRLGEREGHARKEE